jgi:hypothetical protein
MCRMKRHAKLRVDKTNCARTMVSHHHLCEGDESTGPSAQDAAEARTKEGY